jgi:predicted phosphoribosyltransferase
VQAVRQRGPARIVVAVPVGAPGSCAEMQELADEVVCARTPEDFAAVGQFYADFEQTSDAEVRELLRESADANAPH